MRFKPMALLLLLSFVLAGSVEAAPSVSEFRGDQTLVMVDDVLIYDESGGVAILLDASAGAVSCADVTLTDDLAVGDDLAVTGACTVGETLGVTGATSIGGTLAVTGALSVADPVTITHSPASGSSLDVVTAAGAADEMLVGMKATCDNSAGTALTSGALVGVWAALTGHASDSGGYYMGVLADDAVDSGGASTFVGVQVGTGYDYGLLVQSGGAAITGGLIVDSVTVAQAVDAVSVADDSDTNNAQLYVDHDENYFFGILNADCSDSDANSSLPTTGGGLVFVEDNDASGTGSTSGSPVYLLDGVLSANMSDGYDVWCVTSGGHLLHIDHNTGAAGGTPVYFDDGDSAAERLHADGGGTAVLSRSLL